MHSDVGYGSFEVYGFRLRFVDLQGCQKMPRRRTSENYIYIHLNVPLPIDMEVYADLHRLHARKCSKSTSPTAFDSSLKP